MSNYPFITAQLNITVVEDFCQQFPKRTWADKKGNLHINCSIGRAKTPDKFHTHVIYAPKEDKNNKSEKSVVIGELKVWEPKENQSHDYGDNPFMTMSIDCTALSSALAVCPALVRTFEKKNGVKQSTVQVTVQALKNPADKKTHFLAVYDKEKQYQTVFLGDLKVWEPRGSSESQPAYKSEQDFGNPQEDVSNNCGSQDDDLPF